MIPDKVQRLIYMISNSEHPDMVSKSHNIKTKKFNKYLQCSAITRRHKETCKTEVVAPCSLEVGAQGRVGQVVGGRRDSSETASETV